MRDGSSFHAYSGGFRAGAANGESGHGHVSCTAPGTVGAAGGVAGAGPTRHRGHVRTRVGRRHGGRGSPASRIALVGAAILSLASVIDRSAGCAARRHRRSVALIAMIWFWSLVMPLLAIVVLGGLLSTEIRLREPSAGPDRWLASSSPPPGTAATCCPSCRWSRELVRARASRRPGRAVRIPRRVGRRAGHAASPRGRALATRALRGAPRRLGPLRHTARRGRDDALDAAVRPAGPRRPDLRLARDRCRRAPISC